MIPAAKTIKICGLTDELAVKTCADVNVGFNGFIAYPPSPRHVSPQHYAMLRTYMLPTTKAVLVTVDADDACFDDYIQAAMPDMLQLHGNESPVRCAELTARYGLPIIKAFGIRMMDDLDIIYKYAPVINMALLDTATSSGHSGGTGLAFDWSILNDFTLSIPYFLSGGIGEHNIADAVALNKTPYIDLSSSMESNKGVKDPNKILSFVKRLECLSKNL